MLGRELVGGGGQGAEGQEGELLCGDPQVAAAGPEVRTVSATSALVVSDWLKLHFQRCPLKIQATAAVGANEPNAPPPLQKA